MGKELKEHYSEIEAYASLINEKVTVSSKHQLFRENRFYVASPGFFGVFPYPFEKGDATSSFKPGTIVITAKTAKKYFGEADPLHQILEVDGKSHEVAGVLKDIPLHTDLKFDALMATDNLENYGWTFNYILFRNKMDARTFQPKLDRIFAETLQLEFDEYGTKGQYHMEALPDIHFGSEKLFDTPKSSKANLYIFSTVAVLILIIAGINYVNISLANATKRQA